jgi:uncharacterized protein (DUF1800 family)
MYLPKLLSLIFFLPVLAFTQPYTDYVGAGHNKGIIVTSSSNQQLPDWVVIASGDKTLSGQGLEGKSSEAARFLSQAAFGANEKEVVYTAEKGLAPWIDEQFNMPLFDYYAGAEDYLNYINSYLLSQGVDSSELGFSSNWTHWRYAYWNNTVYGKDQLRQRMAFALSQILVVSDESIESADALAGYYNLLSKNAFGNYRDLLLEVALNPTMGYYLSHLNNPREIPEENIHPDQNFAREIMQLFSIGLFQLNTDGSKILDTNGKQIPTYDNEQIGELAKVFTGLGIGAAQPEMGDLYFGRGIYGSDMRVPMIMYEDWHQQGPKVLLNGLTIPDGQTGMKDIEDAIDMLFNHPSCPPFISRQLIQRFVKSNPSPAYIQRVSNKFINDGNGVRGNLKEVIKAILLDPEARDCATLSDPQGGKLSEPTIRQSRIFKNLGLKHEKEDFFLNHSAFYGELTQQHPLGAASVFNFFTPDNSPGGEISALNLVAPEFQILNSLSVIYYPNLIRNGIFYENVTDYWVEGQSFDTYLNTPQLFAFANDNEVLINKIDMLFTNGNMSPFTRSIIIEALQTISPSLNGLTDKIKLALYLTLISPDFIIEK